ncbi:MAG: hypothetical protein K0S39_2743 [Paenibacillus sp.]|jgi:uncharacterized protein (DUF342 family)|nr:hypothetical protein [Paenibacillus sp.]
MTTHISEDELLRMIKSLQTDPIKIPEQEQDNSPGRSANQGWVQVENNKITVSDPEEGGPYAVIEAAPPVKLKVNGIVIEQPARVRESDKIEWFIDYAPLFKIEVTHDKMKALFILNARDRYDWQLTNKSASPHAVIEAFEDRSTILETVHLSNVMLEINQQSIMKNLKPSAIYQELQNPTYEPVTVASGIQPTASSDAQLEVYFNEQVENNFHEIHGVVDYRNHLHIPSVKKGDIIAKKIPLTEGTVGYDIFGNIVKPQPPKDIIILAKDHVEISASGEVFALKEGRPRITGQKIKCFDISTAYIVSGDVDLKTGNIVFSGDVIVYGDVMDGMIIESLGNVYISGNVYKATVTATGSITIRGNILGSNLYSGYFGVIFNRLYMSTKKLSENLHELLDASKLLVNIIEGKGKTVQAGQVVLTMMENKYRDIPQTVKDILSCIANIQTISAGELKELKEKLELFLHPLQIAQLQSFSYIFSIQNIIQETFQSIERMQEPSVQIDINQCHLSNVKSNGDILIRREGVLQSTLYSKGNIIFFGHEAVCRGSQLEAGDSICAMYVGGETGGQTLLKAGKKVTLRKVNSARISVGKFWRDFFEPAEHLVLRTNGYELIMEKD